MQARNTSGNQDLQRPQQKSTSGNHIAEMHFSRAPQQSSRSSIMGFHGQFSKNSCYP